MSRRLVIENVTYHPFLVRFVVAGRRRRATVWAPAERFLAGAIAGVGEERFTGEVLRVTSVREVA